MGRIQWKTFSVTIERGTEEVYEYIMNPENFAEWAISFCRSVKKTDSGWSIETAEGPMSLRFADGNPYGIMDHYVRAGAGNEKPNPARVIPDASGSKVIFTVFQAEDEADREYATTFRNVEEDLLALKSVLEKRTI
ncbi:SRPBCC family protein [Cohnella faecalis]|uniref:SRPBCC family protein n=2 Tax=Cohnella faecalis TaxID=2315694 RepID=A0A398CL98_9BACL|nr:SRPBCC family protein [Cohnella faecalis]